MCYASVLHFFQVLQRYRAADKIVCGAVSCEWELYVEEAPSGTTWELGKMILDRHEVRGGTREGSSSTREPRPPRSFHLYTQSCHWRGSKKWKQVTQQQHETIFLWCVPCTNRGAHVVHCINKFDNINTLVSVVNLFCSLPVFLFSENGKTETVGENTSSFRTCLERDLLRANLLNSSKRATWGFHWVQVVGHIGDGYRAAVTFQRAILRSGGMQLLSQGHLKKAVQ